MAFAVSVPTSNGGKFTSRFPTAELALTDALEREAHDEQGVTIMITSTEEIFTVQEFALKMTEASST